VRSFTVHKTIEILSGILQQVETVVYGFRRASVFGKLLFEFATVSRASSGLGATTSSASGDGCNSDDGGRDRLRTDNGTIRFRGTHFFYSFVVITVHNEEPIYNLYRKWTHKRKWQYM
jgi:hypothetical protein